MIVLVISTVQVNNLQTFRFISYRLTTSVFQYIYVIYRLRDPDEKNCARGLENGRSPKGEGRFQDRGHSFSHPDRSCW